jgi:cytochrome P450
MNQPQQEVSPIKKNLVDEVQRLLAGDPELIADPYPLYRRLQMEAPVCRDGGQVLFTRYADVARILKDPRYSNEWIDGPTMRRRLQSVPEDDRALLAEIQQLLSHFMTLRDAPEHTRLRKLAHLEFTPRRVAELKPRIERTAADLLDRVGDREEFELISEFSHLLPLWTICDLLGIEREDAAQIHEWAGAWATFMSYDSPDMSFVYPQLEAFVAYIRELISDPPPKARAGLLGAWVELESEGDQLSEQELIIMVLLFLFAGHETTTNLITNGTLALLRNPSQIHLLRDHDELMPTAVNEFLRFESPVQDIMRLATEHESFNGVEVQPGDSIKLMLGAANRDPEQFDRAGELVIERPTNRLVAFGMGPHFCLGASLARLEGEVAFRALLDRFEEISFAGEEVRWAPNAHFRGLSELPLKVRRAR